MHPEQGVPPHPEQGVSPHPERGVPPHPEQGVPPNPEQGVPLHPERRVHRTPSGGYIALRTEGILHSERGVSAHSLEWDIHTNPSGTCTPKLYELHSA